MSHSIVGWLPLGVLVLFLIGFVIWVHLKEHSTFGATARPRWPKWLTRLFRLVTPWLPALNLFVIGFVIGSLVMLYLEKFGVVFTNSFLILPIFRGNL